MAMIKCPHCKNDISNESEKCVYCGNYVLENVCPECGNQLDISASICEKCGCPIGKKFNTKKLLFSKKIIILIAIFIIVLLISLISIYINMRHNDKLNEYKQNLNTMSILLLKGSAEAEECADLIKDVWYNTIWEEDDEKTDKYTKKYGIFNEDFNDSINTLFDDDEFEDKIDKIKENRTTATKMMREMKDYPNEYRDSYTALKKYYHSYSALIDLCINPSGSFNTYSSQFIDVDAKVLSNYNEFKLYTDWE